MRFASDNVDRGYLVVPEAEAAAQAKAKAKSKPKTGKANAAAAKKKAKRHVAPTTATASDWSQAFGLMVHKLDPATSALIGRAAGQLALDVHTPARKDAFVKMAASAKRAARLND